MNESQKLLSSILETAQMGQVGIRAALDMQMQPQLRLGLESQLREYDEMEGEASQIAADRGWNMPGIGPAARLMAKTSTLSRLSFGDVNSKIAAMMIQGSTRGMILGRKNMNNCQAPDGQIFALAQKMLDCEEHGIRQMQPFL